MVDVQHPQLVQHIAIQSRVVEQHDGRVCSATIGTITSVNTATSTWQHGHDGSHDGCYPRRLTWIEAQSHSGLLGDVAACYGVEDVVGVGRIDASRQCHC